MTCTCYETDNPNMPIELTPGCPVHDEAPTSRQDKADRRRDLRCSCCPPHKGENAKRKPKHGAQKKRRAR